MVFINPSSADIGKDLPVAFYYLMITHNITLGWY
jgi:hypothetical protein